MRPWISGRSRITWRSKRPGRSSAGSSTSGRFVAAMTITFVEQSNPSISTRIWLSVCSRSSWLPPSPAPRWRPTASISSTKTMHGAFRLAWSKRSRTRLAPTPTNISTNSDPEMLKNGTPASPATARESSVLPVPGGPTSSTPRGMRAPSAANFSGYLRNSTTSTSSSLASSTPATSEKTTEGRFAGEEAGAALAERHRLVVDPCDWRIMKTKMPIRKSVGRMKVSAPARRPSGSPVRTRSTRRQVRGVDAVVLEHREEVGLRRDGRHRVAQPGVLPVLDLTSRLPSAWTSAALCRRAPPARPARCCARSARRRCRRTSPTWRAPRR